MSSSNPCDVGGVLEKAAFGQRAVGSVSGVSELRGRAERDDLTDQLVTQDTD